MEIVEEGGFLSAHLAGEFPEEGIIFDIPSDLFPSPYDFKLSLADERIVIDYKMSNMPQAQERLFRLMIELYNETGKIGARKNNIALQLHLKAPKILELLREARADQTNKTACGLLDRGDIDGFLIHSFFKTRVLGLKRQKADPVRRVIMPVIDVLNHHSQGAGFRHTEDDDGVFRMKLKARRPLLPDSDECFGRYGPNDALDSLLAYDYADDSAPFVRSVPMTIELEGIGEIVIGSFGGEPVHSDLPPHVKDLAFYIPHTRVYPDENRAVMAFALIPGPQAPKALRRVLAFVLSMLRPNLPPGQVRKLVKKCEDRIIEHNLKYYDSLESALSASRILLCERDTHILKDMIRIQCAKLKVYEKSN